MNSNSTGVVKKLSRQNSEPLQQVSTERERGMYGPRDPSHGYEKATNPFVCPCCAPNLGAAMAESSFSTVASSQRRDRAGLWRVSAFVLIL